MSRVMAVEVYKFSELSERAKEKAREWWRTGGFDYEWWGGFDYEWWDAVEEDAKTCFGFVGFRIDKLCFSGFSSQGDGACFEGSWYARDVKSGALVDHAPVDVELASIAKAFEQLARDFPEASFVVKHSGRYCHEFSTDFTVEFGDDPIEGMDYGTPEWADRGALLQEAEEALIEVARDAMRWTYKQLEKEYDHMNSDEQVDEVIEMNEYEFTAEGKRCAVIA